MSNSKYNELIPRAERGELMLDVCPYIMTGASTAWSSLALLRAIGKGSYFTQSNRTSMAKRIAEDHPELYAKLQFFFHQNTPESIDE